MNKFDYISEGVRLARAGYFQEARIKFESAIDCDPDFGYSWHNLANVYFHEERWAEALPHFERAIKLDPSLDESYLTAGACLSHLGMYDDAIRVYDQGLAVQPENADIWFNKGYALEKLFRIPESIAAFDHALSIRPNDRDAAHNRKCILGGCQSQGYCQMFVIEGPDIIPMQGEIYNFEGIHFVTLSIDDPDPPTREKDENSIR